MDASPLVKQFVVEDRFLSRVGAAWDVARIAAKFGSKDPGFAIVVRLRTGVGDHDLRLIQRIVRLERQLLGDRHAEPQVDAGRIGLIERVGVLQLLFVVDVKAARQTLVEQIRLGEGDAPAAAILALGGAELHVLAAAEEVGLRERHFGDRPFERRIAAGKADRSRRLVLDLDGHDHAVRRRAGPGRDMHRLEEVEVVEPALAAFDQRVIVGVAFADIELAPDHVIAGARVADDVDPLNVDLRRVIDGESERDRVVGVVAIAVRTHIGEGVAAPRQFARHRLDRLVDGGRIVDVARMLGDVGPQIVAGHFGKRDVTVTRWRRDTAGPHRRDGDDVALLLGVVNHVRVDDAKIGIAVAHVVFADRLFVGGERVWVVDVAGLEERQPVHLRRLHQALEPPVREGLLPTKVIDLMPVLSPSSIM